jgi:hypothetical protein
MGSEAVMFLRVILRHFGVLASLLLLPYAVAQDVPLSADSLTSPRDQLVDFLSDYYDLNLSAQQPKEIDASEAELPDKDLTDSVLDNTQAQNDLESLSEPEADISAPFPFYMSAAEYLEERGSGEQDQIELTYAVSVTDAKTGLSADPKTATLTLGPDYAAITRDDKTRIFDFRLNRLLTIRGDEEEPIFENNSIFSLAYKNLNTINSITKSGKLDQIQIGKDASLDAFWLESSLGWSSRPAPEGLNIVRDDNILSASYSDKNVLKLTFGGPEFPSDSHLRTLFAYLHHDLPIHPAILVEMGKLETMPKSVSFLSYSPNYPNGLKTQWRLTGTKAQTQPFPLPPNTKNAVETGRVSPLAFVLFKASKGKTPDKVSSLDDLRQGIFEARSDGKSLRAWLLAKDLANRLGSCEADPALLCQDIEELENAAPDNSALARVSTAVKNTIAKQKQVSDLAVLAPEITDGSAPAFLLKRTGQLRARFKPSELISPELRALRPHRLLEEAIAKNPYDPETYQSLAQVYAAQNRYTESWDLQDALRRLPNIDPGISDQINMAEIALKERAPGFFLQEEP